ncbi:unnamed protein product [Zymoseptoria tritici ST99CH_1E4]|uniref:SGT1-domain-containing protein n=1 Tax=Zymoseptoria tritici ST99CH_1E4 TaxID=1276532 RepID=A0A2H1H414_ZYMTR|nr:unnamed protein product [Zymoseptoria tritici ST99CH_1E4]
MDDQLPDDGLKWFGEGFDGFPKRLPEDCVEYAIHIIDLQLSSIATLRSRLNEIIKAANELKKKHLKDYIWQRESFDLTIHPKFDLTKSATTSTSTTPPHLRGRTNFGDSISDEWLIVYLLHTLSIQFPTAWIQLYDTDGEFLLIEAAASLPKWLNPEIAQNRVWLHAGHLKIIPPSPSSPPRNLSLTEALSTLTTSPSTLLVDPSIEKEAFHRLASYPAAISSSLHHSLTTIPRRLAYILHSHPSSIAAAVEAFYLRDPISLRPLATKDLSTLSFPPEDFVTCSVRYTKVGFAQLRSQVLDPPPAWVGQSPWMGDEKRAMGMKVACGFEMLVGDSQLKDSKVVREVKLLLEDLESGEVALPTDEEIAMWERREDEEGWLDIDYRDFEQELDGKKEGKKGEGFGDESAQENLRKMVSRFQDFLEDDEAGVDGVDDMDDDDDDSASTTSSAPTEQDKDTTSTSPPTPTEEAAFRASIQKTMSMPTHHISESGLLSEARKLALEDEDSSSSNNPEDVDEDEEMRKVIELMESELKGHGALSLDGDGYIRKKTSDSASGKGKGKAKATESGEVKSSDKRSSTTTSSNGKPFFGPERPAHLQPPSATTSKSTSANKPSSSDKAFLRFNNTLPSPPSDDEEEIGPGDLELSSDDEDYGSDYNSVDLTLAKNMLESFKGQAGMGGPAGNLMKALGVGTLPRDEDDRLK